LQNKTTVLSCYKQEKRAGALLCEESLFLYIGDEMDKLDITDLDGSRKKHRRKKAEHIEGTVTVHKVSRRQRKKESPQRQKHPVLYAILDDLEVIGIALAISVFLLEFVIINARVPSGSMVSTIGVGDRLIGFRLAYATQEPQRGDVIIFRFPDDESQRFIKRIIGLPGDTVEIRQNEENPELADVYVNGVKLEEGYLGEPMLYDPVPGGKHTFTVPEGSYLVLGDNRNHSNDARFWTNTYVSKDKILAKAVFRYYSGTTRFLSFKMIQ
jgi:signal peptidase I